MRLIFLVIISQYFICFFSFCHRESLSYGLLMGQDPSWPIFAGPTLDNQFSYILFIRQNSDWWLIGLESSTTGIFKILLRTTFYCSNDNNPIILWEVQFPLKVSSTVWHFLNIFLVLEIFFSFFKWCMLSIYNFTLCSYFSVTTQEKHNPEIPRF